MSIITPVGYNNFEWVPSGKKEGLSKQASVGEPTVHETFKDALYQAAAKFVKAQAEKESEAEAEVTPKDDVKEVKGENPFPKKEEKDDKSDKDDASKDKNDKAESTPEVKEEVSVDVQKAVSELVEKAEKAEDIAAKVNDAVAGLEDVANEIRDAVGATEAVIDVDKTNTEGENASEGLDSGTPDEIEIEISDDNALDGSAPTDMPGTSATPSDELIKSTTDENADCTVCATAPSDFIKTAELSSETKKKLRSYWITQLGYPKEYVDLMLA